MSPGVVCDAHSARISARSGKTFRETRLDLYPEAAQTLTSALKILRSPSPLRAQGEKKTPPECALRAEK